MSLLHLTGEHLLIVVVAVTIAIAAGVPLGTLLGNHRHCYHPLTIVDTSAASGARLLALVWCLVNSYAERYRC